MGQDLSAKCKTVTFFRGKKENRRKSSESKSRQTVLRLNIKNFLCKYCYEDDNQVTHKVKIFADHASDKES
jgi:hypothetical protein